MKMEEAYRELTKHFISCWKDEQGHPLTPIVLENEEISRKSEGHSWVRFSVDIFSFSPDSMGVKGNRRVNRSGIQAVEIYVPLNHKTKELNDLVSKAIRLYEGETFNGVNFRNPSTYVTNEESDSLWYGTVVKIPFEFTEII